MQFVPYVNTQAGLTLTPKQWQELGIGLFAIDALSLLQRPGLELKGAVAAYINCHGKILIDTRMLLTNSAQEIVYRMPDGAKKQISWSNLDEWFSKLGADVIVADNPLLFPKNQTNCISDSDAQARFSISDEPASMALRGDVLRFPEQPFNVLDDDYALDYHLLTDNCLCQTCQQGFTRSYFHHLLTHTPLLAQRFLVQHNVWQANRKISNPDF